MLLGLAGADEATDPIDVGDDDDGPDRRLYLPRVPAGQYVLRVVRVPRPPVNVDDMTRVSVARSGTMTISGAPAVPATAPPPVPADATLVARMLLGVGDRDVTDLIVTLSPGPRVSGRLEFEGSTERPAPASLTGMRIMLDRSDGSASPDTLLATQTGHPDEDGQFKTYGVPPGRYVLRVNPVPAGWFLKSAVYQNRDIADLPLELDSKDANGVVITFTDSPARLSGTVRGANGPDPTAVVLVYPVDSEAWSSSGARARRMRTARAAKDGAYSLLALPGGEYYVVAVQEDALGDWQDPALLRSLSRLAQTIRLLDGEQKTQNLDGGGAALNSWQFAVCGLRFGFAVSVHGSRSRFAVRGLSVRLRSAVLQIGSRFAVYSFVRGSRFTFEVSQFTVGSRFSGSQLHT
jgi:hypothetical protein